MTFRDTRLSATVWDGKILPVKLQLDTPEQAPMLLFMALNSC